MVTPDEIQAAADDLLKAAISGTKTGRSDYVGVVTLEQLYRWHLAMQVLLSRYQGEQAPPEPPTSQQVPDLPDDPVAQACLKQNYLAVADAMERSGWNVDDPHDTYQLALSVLRVANILRKQHHRRVMAVVDGAIKECETERSGCARARDEGHTFMNGVLINLQGQIDLLLKVKRGLSTLAPPGGDTDV